MLNVSKWIKIRFLIDLEEMEDLFHSLPPFQLYEVHRVTSKGEGIVPQAFFLKEYGTYIESLQKGEIPQVGMFSPVLSVTEEALYAMPVEDRRQLYKPQLPVVQMQAHAFRYSPADQSFRSQLFGNDAISWGIQLGYPQIYEDPKTHAIFSTRRLPNGPLFHAIQKWVRSHTLPTPFVVEGKKQNVPIRIGKKCFSWIHAHPQLKGITIDRAADTPSVCKK